MRAAVYEGEGRLVVRDVPEPTPASDEVLVEAAGVCGSDVRSSTSRQVIRRPRRSSSVTSSSADPGCRVCRATRPSARASSSIDPVWRVILPVRATGELHQHRVWRAS
jgi:hypothetical protein